MAALCLPKGPERESGPGFYRAGIKDLLMRHQFASEDLFSIVV
jgi:hypothetical protein